MCSQKDPYFDWLCTTVNNRDYIELAWALHQIKFQAKLPMDKNRGMDGIRLRVDFMERYGELGSSVNRTACTMLELLVSLAKKMSFLMGGNAKNHHTAYYFSILLKNLRLDKLTDDNWFRLNGEFFVEDTIFRVVDRQYDYNGNGGLFPLRHAYEDQREVDIWYQMHAWLTENSDENLTID